MTTAKRWSLSVPVDGFSLAELPELAREGERLGYTDAWSYEADGLDCFTPLAAAATATRLRLGTAIANVFTRGPATLAMSAAGIAEIARGGFCLGIGAGSPPIVESWNGGAFAKPLTRVRETAPLRASWANVRVRPSGAVKTPSRSFSDDALTPSSSAAVAASWPRAPAAAMRTGS